jgi:hypothetical protein
VRVWWPANMHVGNCWWGCNTGRFIMFSVIANVYKKKAIGPTLMELFTATGKLKKFFILTTRDVRCMHHGWYGTHRYDVQVLATHTSTWVHRYSSLLQWSVPLGQRGHVATMGRIPGFWHILKGGSFAYFARNALCTVTTDLLVWYSNTKWLLPPCGHFLTKYTRIAWRQ